MKKILNFEKCLLSNTFASYWENNQLYRVPLHPRHFAKTSVVSLVGFQIHQTPKNLQTLIAAFDNLDSLLIEI
jgi:hypothetical protein